MNKRVYRALSSPSPSYITSLGGCYCPNGALTLSNTLGSFLAAGASSEASSADGVSCVDLSSSVARVAAAVCRPPLPASKADSDCAGPLELGEILFAFLFLSRRVMVEGGTDLGVGGGDALGSR